MTVPFYEGFPWRVRGRLSAIIVAAVVSTSARAAADEQQPQQPADPSAPVVQDPSAAHEHPPGEAHGHEHAPGEDHHHAHPPEEETTVTVSGERTPAAASAVTVTGGELKLRPKMRPADILQVTPGLFAVQHAGGGKANQYFLRGFDIDHGTDLALYVDGVPVNQVSHGHGQGYADLHFLIPELVSRVDAYKGPYYAQFGDFATAGAVEMTTADHFDESQASFSVGRFGILRGLGIVSREIGDDWRFVVAGEGYAQDGPFENAEDLERYNAFARVTHDLTQSSSVSLTWMSYSGRWNASGQIPLREVEAGRLDRFGTIDPLEGGTTQRHSGALRIQSRGPGATYDVTAYAVRYSFRLFSNFTFFLDDPVFGDMIEQTDDRTTMGVDARTKFHHHLGPVRLQTSAGLQVRGDSIDNGLYHDFGRERLDPRVDAGITQTGIGFFVDEEARFTKWLALRAGVRVDRADVTVEDRLDDFAVRGDGGTGTQGATLLSPKAALILSPLKQLDFYVDFGRGFHSNDARGATRFTDRATLLVPATGYEAGVRVKPWKPLTLSAAAYRLDLDSEQVYVGDAGTTEPSDPTIRRGAELGARLYFGRWLFADADFTVSDAVYRSSSGNGGSVALAPTRTFTGGVGFRAPFGTFGSLRVRSIAERPAVEDGSIVAEGFTIVDAQVGHRVGPVEVAVDAQNLLNTEWREVEVATESRLAGEPAPVEEIHFAPGWPLTIVGRATVYF